MSDRDLLQEYLQGNTHSFTALVGRHLDLVYSAALRQVRSSQLAEEVAQTVFLDLARRAHTFSPGQPVVAWLFVVTRRTAIDTLRSESRRAAREQAAAEIAAMTTPSPTWVRIKDEIDDALSTLGDHERAAILLRFFENKSLREVGSSLGISEDTAQKRVSRALDRLRDRLIRRGIAVSSVGLAADLSAHALHVAPTALGPTIAAALPIGAAATVSTPFAAAFLSHAVATTVIVGALGFAAMEAIAFVRQRDDIVSTRLEIDRQRDALAALRTTQADATKRLQQARDEQAHASALSATDPAVEAAIAAWLQRLERLRSLAATRSDLAIPEFAALGDDDWFTLARDAAFETEAKLGETFLAVRAAARRATAQIFFRALRLHADAHAGWLPAAPIDLAAHIPQRLPAELYSRYEMLHAGELASASDDAWLLAERLVTAAPRGDRVFVGRQRHGISEWPKKE